jgi:hypothetical protein
MSLTTSEKLSFSSVVERTLEGLGLDGGIMLVDHNHSQAGLERCSRGVAAKFCSVPK